MRRMLRICQRAPTFKNQEMYTIRYSYPMLRCNACTKWPQDAASDTATQCKNSMTLHTHTMICLDEVALARLNALNILTQIFEKKDDSSRSGYDRITAQGGHPCHPCLLVQCLFHIVEDLPSPHQSIQDICLEPASSQIPRVWFLWAWISRSVTQVLANLMKLSSVHFRFSPTMQGSRTEYGWPYHASSRHRTHARTHHAQCTRERLEGFPERCPGASHCPACIASETSPCFPFFMFCAWRSFQPYRKSAFGWDLDQTRSSIACRKGHAEAFQTSAARGLREWMPAVQRFRKLLCLSSHPIHVQPLINPWRDAAVVSTDASFLRNRFETSTN